MPAKRQKSKGQTSKPTSGSLPKSRMRPAYQVFVSHATADKWIATVVCEKIEATGATSFRDDRDINDFERYLAELARRVNK